VALAYREVGTPACPRMAIMPHPNPASTAQAMVAPARGPARPPRGTLQ
jgi:hypothetical protein